LSSTIGFQIVVSFGCFGQSGNVLFSGITISAPQQSVLYLVRISPCDPVLMAGAPIALILIAVLACLVPATIGLITANQII
jgi:hypothetical protein